METQNPEPIDNDAKAGKKVLDSSILKTEIPPRHFEVGSAAESLSDPWEFFVMNAGFGPEWPVQDGQTGKVDNCGDALKDTNSL